MNQMNDTHGWEAVVWNAVAFGRVSSLFSGTGAPVPLGVHLLENTEANMTALAVTGTGTAEESALFAEFVSAGPFVLLVAAGLTEQEITDAKSACAFSCGLRSQGHGSSAVVSLIETSGFAPVAEE